MMRYLNACTKAVAAFVRAVDAEAARLPSGRPHLQQWSLSDNPYERLFYKKRVGVDSNITSVIVFASGRQWCEYLSESVYTLGDGCMNDIVTTSGDVLPTLCTLHVGPNELRIIAAPGVLMTINHESCEQGILIDQDVVSVGSVTFFYIGLGGADAGH